MFCSVFFLDHICRQKKYNTCHSNSKVCTCLLKILQNLFTYLYNFYYQRIKRIQKNLVLAIFNFRYNHINTNAVNIVYYFSS